MARSDAMSERSQADCSVTKLRLAAVRKPSVSKPSGTPQFCEPARAEPICTPEPEARAAGWWFCSQGRAEASLPTFSGLYWRASGALSTLPPILPAPAGAAFWKAKGLDDACCAPADARRERMTMPTTTMMTRASRPISRNWPKAAPRPSELASQARPRPAAKPPSMAPQGFLAGAAAGAVAGLPAAFCVAAFCGGVFCVGARAASRCVTLLDCLPTDPPPPMRLASAVPWTTTSIATKTIDHSFFMSSPRIIVLPSPHRTPHALST